MKKVLVTGVSGFLGYNSAKFFIDKGFNVFGIDISDLPSNIPITFHKCKVIFDNLINLNHEFCYVIHCAGGATVGQSLKNPYEEYDKTVNSTIELLEYLRQYNKNAKLIYPSSAAVYGNDYYQPIKETDKLNPISPYGCYKKIVEELCEIYYKNFGVKSNIIRFFSIYGENLKKQLLWDACNKIKDPNVKNEFFGTGEEVRDWIYVQDALSLIYYVAQYGKDFDIFNGGGGQPVKIKQLLSFLSKKLNNENFLFNNQVKTGDPKCFIADINKQLSIGWESKYSIEYGINNYVEWFLQN